MCDGWSVPSRDNVTVTVASNQLLMPSAILSCKNKWFIKRTMVISRNRKTWSMVMVDASLILCVVRIDWK
jgi:hypothetical protein